jgi:hypothetical protein
VTGHNLLPLPALPQHTRRLQRLQGLVSVVGTNHWAIRAKAARCVASLAKRFPQPQLGLMERVCGLCLAAFLDKNKPLSTHYGAILGISGMCPRAVRLLLLPHLVEYYNRLAPVLVQVSVPGAPSHMISH